MIISYENIKKLAQENQYKLKNSEDKRFKRLKNKINKHIKKCAKNGYTKCEFELKDNYYAQLFKKFYRLYGFGAMVIDNTLYIYWD